MTYKLCKKLIDAGRIKGMRDKLDVFFANDRLTADEYTELTGLTPGALSHGSGENEVLANE